jgi:hypothetical protein
MSDHRAFSFLRVDSAKSKARARFLRRSNARDEVLSPNPHENSVCQLRADKVFVYFTLFNL